jgi:hypothetical protein
MIMMASMVCLNFMVSGVAASPNPHIARWYENKKAAVSLRFDDSLESHVEYVIPKLNEYGIKATFMVTPGRTQYRKYKDFWENEIPKMGHHLGNHTMHHRGANSLIVADYEIGEVSRLLWKLYPDQSKLKVFASGGGKKWGGVDWELAPPDYEYKNFVKKYSLIDLYDGKHPAHSTHSGLSAQVLCGAMDKAIREERHLPFMFHGIGTPTIMDRLKALYRGYDSVVPRSTFEGLIECLNSRKVDLWVAPLLDILKYEAERSESGLEVVSRGKNKIRLFLSVDTDSNLYDHDLTLIIPKRKNGPNPSIVQVGGRVSRIMEGSSDIFVNIKPVSGYVDIVYEE